MPDFTSRRTDPDGSARHALSATTPDDDSRASGVSWGAVIAGATGASALSMVLLILGFGLGLSAVSPWRANGASAAAIGVSTVVWIAFTQIAASGLGGYLAGRLRVKWARLHGDEVYFRDTAHGFLAWAVASLVTATLLSSAIASAIGGGARIGAAVAQGAGAPLAAAAKQAVAPEADPVGYLVDGLMRSETPTDSAAAPSRAEITNLIANSLRRGSLSADDRRYLSTVVARRAGVPQADAERRVDAAYAQVGKAVSDADMAAREAADQARKAATYSALWMVVSLLAGAFFASLAALWGGRQRDAFHPV